MTTPTTPTRHHRNRRPAGLLAALHGLLFLLLLSACGADTTRDDAAAVVTDEVVETSGARAEAVRTQSDTRIATSTEIVLEPADDRGDDPFAPQAEIAACRPDELISFLESDPTVAAAWADAAGVAPDAIAETIRSYEPTVLDRDTRVTNHAYRGGRARAFQAMLEAGTAVLVDDAGVPRVRCACGNPLDEPRPVGEETPGVPTQTPPTPTTTVPVAAPVADFCATWAAVEPTMVGGPSGSGPEAMAEYLGRLVDGFDQLIAAAQATDGFPADALTDLQTYRDAIAEAALTPGDPGPGPEDVLVGMRVEDFLTSYCGGGDTTEDTTDDVRPPQDDDDIDTDDGDDIDFGDDEDGTDTDGPSGNCGSFQFALLILLADDLGIDHAAVSQPYVDAMNALVNGFDPGPEFDVGDLSLMLANEEIGCQGAQAMQQLLIDLGYGPLIEGTELGA